MSNARSRRPAANGFGRESDSASGDDAAYDGPPNSTLLLMHGGASSHNTAVSAALAPLTVRGAPLDRETLSTALVTIASRFRLELIDKKQGWHVKIKQGGEMTMLWNMRPTIAASQRLYALVDRVRMAQ